MGLRPRNTGTRDAAESIVYNCCWCPTNHRLPQRGQYRPDEDDHRTLSLSLTLSVTH